MEQCELCKDSARRMEQLRTDPNGQEEYAKIQKLMQRMKCHLCPSAWPDVPRRCRAERLQELQELIDANYAAIDNPGALSRIKKFTKEYIDIQDSNRTKCDDLPATPTVPDHPIDLMDFPMAISSCNRCRKGSRQTRKLEKSKRRTLTATERAQLQSYRTHCSVCKEAFSSTVTSRVDKLLRC